MSYIGKIRIEDAQAMAAADEQGQSAYGLAAQFNAVRIGESPTFYFYHVNHPSAIADSLPGEVVAEDYDSLPSQVAPFVLEATYEDTETIDGEEVTVTKRVKERDVPDGITPIETGLVPHRFA